MQMSQKMSLEDTRRALLRATMLVNGGMVLEKRHYEMLRQAYQRHAHILLATKWFGEWVRTHKEWIVLYYAKHDAPTFETIVAYIKRRDEEKLQRMLRRMRNGN